MRSITRKICGIGRVRIQNLLLCRPALYPISLADPQKPSCKSSSKEYAMTFCTIMVTGPQSYLFSFFLCLLFAFTHFFVIKYFIECMTREIVYISILKIKTIDFKFVESKQVSLKLHHDSHTKIKHFT